MPEIGLERCLIDIEHELCICSDYEINENYIGRLGDTYDMPYSHCHKLVGFTPNNWWELRNWIGEIQATFNRD